MPPQVWTASFQAYLPTISTLELVWETVFQAILKYIFITEIMLQLKREFLQRKTF